MNDNLLYIVTVKTDNHTDTWTYHTVQRALEIAEYLSDTITYQYIIVVMVDTRKAIADVVKLYGTDRREDDT